jgi:hypothetical protein
MSAEQRRARAEARRHRATLRKTQLRPIEDDLSPVRGAAALSLVHRLTKESWSMSGRDEPVYTRDQIPCRFVPGRLT